MKFSTPTACVYFSGPSFASSDLCLFYLRPPSLSLSSHHSSLLPILPPFLQTPFPRTLFPFSLPARHFHLPLQSTQCTVIKASPLHRWKVNATWENQRQFPYVPSAFCISWRPTLKISLMKRVGIWHELLLLILLLCRVKSALPLPFHSLPTVGLTSTGRSPSMHQCAQNVFSTSKWVETGVSLIN